MPSKIPLSFACGAYEITRPLQEGSVEPDGIDLTILTAMDSSTRHWRFLRAQAFDIAELSSSSYLLAFDQGLAPSPFSCTAASGTGSSSSTRPRESRSPRT